MEIILLLLALFVLSIFLGVELINKVPPTLHTPLMSGCNAMSGITIIGAIVALGRGDTSSTMISALAFVALIFATINVVAGFMVTDRMLAMFKRR